jgi:hypothetical protein
MSFANASALLRQTDGILIVSNPQTYIIALEGLGPSANELFIYDGVKSLIGPLGDQQHMLRAAEIIGKLLTPEIFAN